MLLSVGKGKCCVLPGKIHLAKERAVLKYILLSEAIRMFLA